MFARYLETGAEIMDQLPMSNMAASLRAAIDQYAIIPSPSDGQTPIYAYEVDGFSGRILMDDTNIPSLLSMSFLGHFDRDDPIY